MPGRPGGPAARGRAGRVPGPRHRGGVFQGLRPAAPAGGGRRAGGGPARLPARVRPGAALPAGGRAVGELWDGRWMEGGGGGGGFARPIGAGGGCAAHAPCPGVQTPAHTPARLAMHARALRRPAHGEGLGGAGPCPRHTPWPPPVAPTKESLPSLLVGGDGGTLAPSLVGRRPECRARQAPTHCVEDHSCHPRTMLGVGGGVGGSALGAERPAVGTQSLSAFFWPALAAPPPPSTSASSDRALARAHAASAGGVRLAPHQSPTPPLHGGCLGTACAV